MWPHPLRSASSAKWGQVSLTTGLWGAPQMPWCVLSAGPSFFSFCYTLNASQLSTAEGKVMGGAIFEIRNQTEAPDYVQEFLDFLSFPALLRSLPFFLPSILCFPFPFLTSVLKEQNREKRRWWNNEKLGTSLMEGSLWHWSFPGIQAGPSLFLLSRRHISENGGSRLGGSSGGSEPDLISQAILGGPLVLPANNHYMLFPWKSGSLHFLEFFIISLRKTDLAIKPEFYFWRPTPFLWHDLHHWSHEHFSFSESMSLH